MSGEIIYNMPFEEYLELPAVSRGTLWAAGKSAWHASQRLNATPFEETDEMVCGRLFHHRLFFPDDFEANYRLDTTPKPQRIRKGSEAWKAWQEEVVVAAARDAREPVSPAHWDLIDKMINGVERCAEARNLVKKSRPEVTVIWQDPTYGFSCKARLDLLEDADPPTIIGDVKTVADATPWIWERQAARFGYHIQAVHYCRGISTILSGSVPRWVFLVCEKAEPYATRAITYTTRAWDEANEDYDLLVERLARMLQTQQWRRFPPGVREMGLPSFARIAQE